MYDDVLPVTGAGALLVGSHAIGLPTVVTVAAGLVVGGLIIARLATRRMRATTLN